MGPLSTGGVGILPGTGGIVELDNGGGVGIDDCFNTDSYFLINFLLLELVLKNSILYLY